MTLVKNKKNKQKKQLSYEKSKMKNTYVKIKKTQNTE